MKYAVVMASMLISLAGQANTLESVFKKGSEIPTNLQAKILSKIQAAVPCLEPFSLTEQSTNVTVDRVDQGITDVYYNTKFTLHYIYDYHPRRTTITVVSGDFEFYCADNCDLKVIDVDVAGQVCE